MAVRRQNRRQVGRGQPTYKRPWMLQPFEHTRGGVNVWIKFLILDEGVPPGIAEINNFDTDYETANPPPFKTEVVGNLRTVDGLTAIGAFWTKVGIFGGYNLQLQVSFDANLADDDLVIFPPHADWLRGPFGEFIAPGFVPRNAVLTRWPPTNYETWEMP